MFRNVTAAVLLLAFVAAPLRAFDTGHHSDLTRAVLSRYGFSEHAIQTVQVANWLTDYYTNSPSAPSEVKAELEKLHFDCLFKTGDIDRYWKNLATNTKDEVRSVMRRVENTEDDAARSAEITRFLMLLGISLHAVQDFYTHSNWVETHTNTQSSNYETATWWTDLADGRVKPERDGEKSYIYTGWYKNALYKNKPADARAEHGDYDDDGLNHDSYSREPKRHWDQAYVFAYAGTIEWVNAVLAWAKQIKPDFDNDLKNYKLPWGTNAKLGSERLEVDLNASWRISEWIPLNGADGHWKGRYSGIDLTSFLAFQTKWMSGGNSFFVDAIKTQRVQNKLSSRLYDHYVPGTVDSPPRVPVRGTAVSIRTKKIWKPSDARVYARIRVGAEGKPDKDLVTYLEAAHKVPEEVVEPKWWTIHFVDSNVKKVRVIYELFQEIGPDAEKDPQFNFKGKDNGKALHFTYDFNRELGTLLGDVRSRTNAPILKDGVSDVGKSVTVSFSVGHTPLQPVGPQPVRPQ